MQTPKTHQSHHEQDDPLALFESEREESKARSATEVPGSGNPSPALRQTLEISSPGVGGSLSDAQGAPAGAPSIRADRDSTGISIQAILDAHTPVHWVEAVAIVVRACDALIGEDGSEAPAPEPGDIFIDHDGSVAVASSAREGSSASRLGRTLHSLSSADPMPARLRLLVTTWIESKEPHAVADVRGELLHFAKPNGRDLVKAVYERQLKASDKVATARVTPPQQAPVLQQTTVPREAPGSSAATPVPEPVLARANEPQVAVVLKAPTRLWRKLPFDMMVPAGLACAVVLLGLLAWLMSPASAPASAPPAALETSFTGESTETPVAELAPISNASAVSADVAPIPFGRDIELPAEAAAATRQTVRPAPRSQPSASSAPVNQPATLAPRATPSTSSGNAVLTPEIPGVAASSADTTVLRGPFAPDVAGGRVYTTADAGVEPPIMIYPQVRPSVVGGAESDYNTMEIVISERGLVEQVRLLSEPKRMTDMMLLSGAKTWRFEPASVDGQSVRYRMAITWPTTR